MSLTEVDIFTEPKTEPVKQEDVKRFMSIDVDFTDDDEVIRGMITTARQMAERFLNRSLIEQVREGYWDQITDRIWLPYAPIISVDTVTRFRLNDSTILTENSDYFVQGIKDRWLRFATPFNLPAGHSPNDRFSEFELRIKYTAGYGKKSTDVPFSIREAILMIVATSYSNRANESEEDMMTIPSDARKKLFPYKVIL